jgi:hypothetical protein
MTTKPKNASPCIMSWLKASWADDIKHPPPPLLVDLVPLRLAAGIEMYCGRASAFMPEWVDARGIDIWPGIATIETAEQAKAKTKNLTGCRLGL